MSLNQTNFLLPVVVFNFLGTIMVFSISNCLPVKVLLALIVLTLQSSNVVLKCHHGSSLVNVSLATKTPYRFVANRDDSPPIYKGI